LASPDELEVLGIVAVAGNVPLDRTALNARRIVELAGRPDIAVHAGCARPLYRDLVTAEHVHGPTGLDGFSFPDPVTPLRKQHGVDFLIDSIMRSEPGTITLCMLGPVTNLAMALVKAPEIATRLKQVVMMGGAYFEVGNITPSAEFNILVDPEAADLVLRSGISVTMIPLDLTHKALVTRERLERFRALGNKAGTVVAEMLAFSEQFDRQKYGWDGAPLHDPCVIAYLLRPDLFRGRMINVSVETMSPLTRGMTVADWWQITDRPRNVNFLKDADADSFFELLIGRLARLN
jgi:purine nucleosidase